MKKALITGITGQDGSYLAEFLLSKGYEVHGLIRRANTFNTNRIDHICKDPHIRGVKLHLHCGDLSDSNQLANLIYNIRPDEIYHLGAQSHIRISFDIPEYTADIMIINKGGYQKIKLDKNSRYPKISIIHKSQLVNVII